LRESHGVGRRGRVDGNRSLHGSETLPAGAMMGVFLLLDTY
jgi:hypothetical protein